MKFLSIIIMVSLTVVVGLSSVNALKMIGNTDNETMLDYLPDITFSNSYLVKVH